MKYMFGMAVAGARGPELVVLRRRAPGGGQVAEALAPDLSFCRSGSFCQLNHRAKAHNTRRVLVRRQRCDDLGSFAGWHYLSNATCLMRPHLS